MPILWVSALVYYVNGIDQMEMIEIGGIKQAMYFRGENIGASQCPHLHVENFPFR